jgi:hypothetical protein
LIIAAVALALNDKLLRDSQQCQKQINVCAVIRQMADIDIGRVDLSGVLPKNVTVTGIARCGPSISHVEKQAR